MQEDDLRAGKKPGSPDWGLEQNDKAGVIHTLIEGKSIRENVPTIRGNYYDYFEELYQYLVNDQIAPASAQDGINVMRIIDAAFQSDEQKTIIYFNI